MLCTIICREVSGTKRDRKDPDIVCPRRRQPLSHLVQFAHQRSRLSLSFAFFYIFYIFTSTVSSISHFLHFFSLTPSPHHCLSLKLQTNCVLFVKSKLRKTLDFVNGARARFWAITYKAVKTQPVHAKGQLSVN